VTRYLYPPLLWLIDFEYVVGWMNMPAHSTSVKCINIALWTNGGRRGDSWPRAKSNLKTYEKAVDVTGAHYSYSHWYEKAKRDL